MVDTVLTRDKNWVRWKADGCPPIEKPTISTQEYLETRSNAAKFATTKRLRATPLGSLDLRFLTEDDKHGNLERLKEPER
jgi:THO complex subunit 1